MDDLTHQKKPNDAILITGILLAFLIPLGLTVAIGNVNVSYFDKLFYSRFFYWGTVLFLFFYARQVERGPLLIWPENNAGTKFFLSSVVILYLLFIAAAIVSAIPMLFGWRESNEVMKMIARLLKGQSSMMFFIALTAGVTEEFIFRGYILTRLLQIFKNPYIPVILSSILFSALHYKFHSLREFIFTFLIGVIFSLYYIKYRNIKALMLTHFLIDFISLMLAQHLKMK